MYLFIYYYFLFDFRTYIFVNFVFFFLKFLNYNYYQMEILFYINKYLSLLLPINFTIVINFLFNCYFTFCTTVTTNFLNNRNYIKYNINDIYI